MTTRAQRLLTTAMNRANMSFEEFADEYPKAVAYKSGRTLRRYAETGDIPPYVVDALRDHLNGGNN